MTGMPGGYRVSGASSAFQICPVRVGGRKAQSGIRHFERSNIPVRVIDNK